MSQRGVRDHGSPGGHGFPERSASEGYSWRRISENLSAGYLTPKSNVDAWICSPGHLENILDQEFNDVGIGYSQPLEEEKRSRYNNFWVVIFGVRAR